MKSVYPLILLSVAISAFAQIALKAGMASASVQRAIAEGTPAGMLLGIGFNPFVMLGLFLYFSSAAVWLFVALGFVLTALLGRFFFNDSFSAAKIVGTLLIMGGVVVLARG